MLLAIFSESLLPYLEELDSWLYDGILDDPYEEVSLINFFAFSVYLLDEIYFHGCVPSSRTQHPLLKSNSSYLRWGELNLTPPLREGGS